MTAPPEIGPSSVPILLALGMIVFGLMSLVLGIFLLGQHSGRRRSWTRMPGVAYGYVRRGSANSTQQWLLRWTGPDGVERRCRNPFGVSSGTTRRFPFPVELLVDPNNPERAQVAAGPQGGTPVAMILTAFGAFVLIVGAGLAIAVFD
jgi:hypothetical protein